MAGRKIDAMHDAYGKSVHKCKDCDHFVVNEFSRRYFKCCAYGDSRSESTDWRANWTACGLFNKSIKGLVPMVDRLKHASTKSPDEQLEGQIGMEELL